jgi:hypothetical protein
MTLHKSTSFCLSALLSAHATRLQLCLSCVFHLNLYYLFYMSFNVPFLISILFSSFSFWVPLYPFSYFSYHFLIKFHPLIATLMETVQYETVIRYGLFKVSTWKQGSIFKQKYQKESNAIIPSQSLGLRDITRHRVRLAFKKALCHCLTALFFLRLQPFDPRLGQCWCIMSALVSESFVQSKTTASTLILYVNAKREESITITPCLSV